MLKFKLANGKATIAQFDDGMADGVVVMYTDNNGDESMIRLDVLKETGEARAIIYPVSYDEPTEAIPLN